MFKKISDLLDDSTTLKMIVRKLDDGTLSVTAEPIPSKGIAPIFAPLVVSGTPEELDAEFDTILESHTVIRSSLISQVEEVKANMAESVKNATEQAKAASGSKQRVIGQTKSAGASEEGLEEGEDVEEAFGAAGVTSIKSAKSGATLSSIELF